ELVIAWCVTHVEDVVRVESVALEQRRDLLTLGEAGLEPEPIVEPVVDGGVLQILGDELEDRAAAHERTDSTVAKSPECGVRISEDGTLEHPRTLLGFEGGRVAPVLRATGEKLLELAGEVAPDGLAIATPSLVRSHPGTGEDARREVGKEGHRVGDG